MKLMEIVGSAKVSLSYLNYNSLMGILLKDILPLEAFIRKYDAVLTEIVEYNENSLSSEIHYIFDNFGSYTIDAIKAELNYS